MNAPSEQHSDAHREPQPEGSRVAVRLNGRPEQVDAGTTVAEIVRRAGLTENALFAVERNRQVVPRANHASTRVEDGDEIEVVTAVGGG